MKISGRGTNSNMKSRFPGFSPDALAFLRALKRNNRREWFQARKDKYESLIKLPMMELVGSINEELARFAPAYVRRRRRRSIASTATRASPKTRRLTKRTSRPSSLATLP